MSPSTANMTTSTSHAARNAPAPTSSIREISPTNRVKQSRDSIGELTTATTNETDQAQSERDEFLVECEAVRARVDACVNQAHPTKQLLQQARARQELFQKTEKLKEDDQAEPERDEFLVECGAAPARAKACVNQAHAIMQLLQQTKARQEAFQKSEKLKKDQKDIITTFKAAEQGRNDIDLDIDNYEK
ncbi:hypothetical protein EJ04DRAFT_515153 [Polyplosphaeria fusca]|uniref:Uncharacterized protein n=1 Tax=Polyplosphaeria fusca TaxID=682080 RepID=A0A9P4UXQ0_9PLEO|nr:hypothetical protein EJ04DRAFT_515153 [Polyplosphaeria fusca]